MNNGPFSDMAVPVDPYVARCQENAHRLQILRERIAAERERLAAERGDPGHEPDHYGLAAKDEAPH